MPVTIELEKQEGAAVELCLGPRTPTTRIPNSRGLFGKIFLDNTKPHYALHILAVHASGIEDDKARAGVALALASQLGGDRPKGVQAYLIQELQVVGGKEAVGTLGKLLLNPDLCDDADKRQVFLDLAAMERDHKLKMETAFTDIGYPEVW